MGITMNAFYFPMLCAATAGLLLPAVADTAPADLTGKTVTADYTQAEFRTKIEEEAPTPWVSFNRLPRNGGGAAEAFMGKAAPKATRDLLPITRPGKGGIYTYRKTGPNTAVISVDMWKAYQQDMCRTYTITFTTPTQGIATEEIGHGDYTGNVRNIRITIK